MYQTSAAAQSGAMGPRTAIPLSKVELHISCKKLKDMDTLSKSDPQVHVSVKLGQEAWRFHDKTEMIKDNLNPNFTKAIKMDYYFEQTQKLRFVVVDIDKPNGRVQDQDFIGELEVNLADIIAAPGQSITKPLSNKKYKKPTGYLTATAQEVQEGKMIARVHMVANRLDKKDFLGKSDPFIRISRSQENSSWTAVHKTEVIKKTLDPRWKPFKISLSTLCSCDVHRPLLFQCYDWNSSGKEDFIGEFKASPKQIMDSSTKEFALINAKKAKKRRYKDSGLVKFLKFEVEEEPSFLDYIRGGCQIGLVVGIDFTASNGNPSYSGSLHFRNPYEPNEYAQAIMGVCDILGSYDSDQMFPCFGFGAKIPPNNQVSHCFPLNGNFDNPEVGGIQAILEAYYAALNNVTLYGPTNFAPIIATAAAEASSHSATGQQYTILLMITDGVISDMSATIEEIVRASNLPLSIVIVGVGKADFTNMDVLDADDIALRSRDGKVAARDIVQFVPFRDFKGSHYSRLAAETLHEIPTQFLSYMQSKGIKPNPPRNAMPVSTPSFGPQSFASTQSQASFVGQPNPGLPAGQSFVGAAGGSSQNPQSSGQSRPAPNGPGRGSQQWAGQSSNAGGPQRTGPPGSQQWNGPPQQQRQQQQQQQQQQWGGPSGGQFNGTGSQAWGPQNGSQQWNGQQSQQWGAPGGSQQWNRGPSQQWGPPGGSQQWNGPPGSQQWNGPPGGSQQWGNGPPNSQQWNGPPGSQQWNGPPNGPGGSQQWNGPRNGPPGSQQWNGPPGSQQWNGPPGSQQWNGPYNGPPGSRQGNGPSNGPPGSQQWNGPPNGPRGSQQQWNGPPPNGPPGSQQQTNPGSKPSSSSSAAGRGRPSGAQATNPFTSNPFQDGPSSSRPQNP